MNLKTVLDRIRQATDYANSAMREWRAAVKKSPPIDDPAPKVAPTVEQYLPARQYRHGMTRRQLRSFRSLTGLKRPHKVRDFVDRKRAIA